MLQFDSLSYWEKAALTEGIDYLVIGGGIVGSATALRLREQHPNATIVIVERGYVPTGASTKNAGFACFGSVTELADDLRRQPEAAVWDTVAMRWRGLQRLRERFDPKTIDLHVRGSWDLITATETAGNAALFEQLDTFNAEVLRITGQADCFSYDTTIGVRCGFNDIHGGFYNRLEGELHTGKLLLATNALLAAKGIRTLNGVTIETIEGEADGVRVSTNFGELKAAKVAVTVNGFAQTLLPDLNVLPARAQVLVTEQIPGFELPGTFHYQQGYYYFRSVDNRLLLGGGRNLDIAGETTTELTTTERITGALQELIRTTILPGKQVAIHYQWAGIMGVGAEKRPVIELVHPHIGVGVRMGGMGVAIGSLVGEELAELLH